MLKAVFAAFFMEMVIHLFKDSLINRKFKRHNLVEIEISCNIMNVFAAF